MVTKTGKSILRFILNHKIMILSFYVALIIPSYCFSSARSYQRQMESFLAEDSKHTQYISFMSEHINSAQRQKITDELQTKHIKLSVREEDILPGFNNISVTAIGIDGDLDYFSKTDIKRGRFFNKKELSKGSPVCILSDNIPEFQSLKPGDKIFLSDQELTIIGFSREYAYSGRLIVPYNQIERIYPHAVLQQSISVSPESLNITSEDLYRVLDEEGLGDDIIEYEKSSDSTDDAGRLVRKLITSRALAGIATFLFSIINIYIVLVGRMQLKKRTYAIQLALGIPRIKLLLHFFSENICCMFLSGVLLFVTFNPLAVMLNLDTEVVFDLTVMIAIMIFSFLFCLILSVLLVRFACQQSIYNMLQQEAI